MEENTNKQALCWNWFSLSWTHKRKVRANTHACTHYYAVSSTFVLGDGVTEAEIFVITQCLSICRACGNGKLVKFEVFADIGRPFKHRKGIKMFST